MNLMMYEDAVEMCQCALELDPKHYKSLYRQAKSLAFLFQFEEAKKILPGNEELKELIF
jgi:hypothetical protein